MTNYSFITFAAEKYDFAKETCRLLTHGREEHKKLYTFVRNDKPYLLRLVKYPFSDVGQTNAEMNWLTFLSCRGVNVPFPLKTSDGDFSVLWRENGESYVLSAFSKAEGRCWDKNDPDLWNTDVFFRWGKITGDMHRLTKDYQPPDNVDTRNTFHMRSMICEKLKEFPTVNKIAENLLLEFETLPRDRNSFGLLHNDLHPNNFSIDGENIHIFDFDSCAYSWYAFEIGNALFLALWLGRSNDSGSNFTNQIIKYFLQGYLSANNLSDFWLSKIPSFMMLCKISLFSFGCDCENPGNQLSPSKQEEQMHAIEKNTLFAECVVDYSLFHNNK